MSVIIFITGTIIGAFLMAMVSGHKYTELENRYHQNLINIEEKYCKTEPTANTDAVTK